MFAASQPRQIALPLLFVAGCSLSEDELWVKVEAAKESSNWDSTLAVSQLILERYPDGRFAGWARFAAAESYRFKNQPREALDHYKIFIERYPDLQPAAVSLFPVALRSCSENRRVKGFFMRSMLPALGKPPRVSGPHSRASLCIISSSKAQGAKNCEQFLLVSANGCPRVSRLSSALVTALPPSDRCQCLSRREVRRLRGLRCPSRLRNGLSFPKS